MPARREMCNGHVVSRERDLIRRRPHLIRSMLESIDQELLDAEARNEVLFNRMLNDLQVEELKQWAEKNMPAYWAAKYNRRNFEQLFERFRAQNDEVRARVAWMLHEWDSQFT